MSWELYEVWHNEDGHEELVDTTKSLKEAKQLAKKTLEELQGEIFILWENQDGEMEEIERLTIDEHGVIINT
jgi:hypothetical protein